MRSSRYFVASALAVALGIFGCDKAPAVTTVPVSGTVTRNGQPVAGATVNFVTGEVGKGAAGETDASGRFTLKTLVAGAKFQNGAMVGDYTVSVTKQAATTVAPDVSKMTPEEGSKRAQEMSTGQYGKDGALDPKTTPPGGELPQKYADATTSGLKASVKAGEANDFKFELAD